MTDKVLEFTGVGKVYPNGTRALRGVDFAVAPGSVHALVGANGAGKSTMIEIIARVEAPTEGVVRWDGSPVSDWTPGAARDGGIGTVHQSFPLVPDLSVLENVFLGHDRALSTRHRAVKLETFHAVCERSGISLDPDSAPSALPVGQRQLVGLIQALVLGARLVVLDEPTASLSQRERVLVFDVVRRLRASGTAFVYVSHHLDEVADLSDEMTVLRDGAVVARHRTAQTTKAEILHEMTGSALTAVEDAPPQRPVDTGADIALELCGVSTGTGLRGIDLQVARGEIVGIFGMIGSGRTELLRAAFGADRLSAGEVRVHGRRMPQRPSASIAAGVAFVPEDRKSSGLFLDWEIWRNVGAADLRSLSRRGILDHDREIARAEHVSTELDILAQDVYSTVDTLSGRNQQKVVFGRWVDARVDVFLLDEPTVAVDVHAKAQILQLVQRLAAAGCAVVINSSEPEELLAVAHRILVLEHGRIVDIRDPATTSHADLLARATEVSA